jgi:hypothetical protein
MYVAIERFRDGNENAEGHIYEVGDKYPFQKYAGAETKDRIAELTKEDGPNESFVGPVIALVKDDDTEEVKEPDEEKSDGDAKTE